MTPPRLEPTPPCAEPTNRNLFDTEDSAPWAIDICRPCPHRLSCLNLVDPARSWYEGTAGGHYWNNGQPDPNYSNLNEPILVTYLTARGIVHDREPIIDMIAIRALIDRRITWDKLSRTERVIAAKLMNEEGFSTADIQVTTRLNGSTIRASTN